MTDYTNLVKALRCKRDDCEGCNIAFFDKDEGWMCRYAAKDDDAAAAIEALQARLGEAENSVERWKDMYLTKHEPKRGEWKCSYPEIEPNPMFMYGICSICGFEQSISNKLNYCPNCGAKMEVLP